MMGACKAGTDRHACVGSPQEGLAGSTEATAHTCVDCQHTRALCLGCTPSHASRYHASGAPPHIHALYVRPTHLGTAAAPLSARPVLAAAPSSRAPALRPRTIQRLALGSVGSRHSSRCRRCPEDWPERSDGCKRKSRIERMKSERRLPDKKIR